MKTKRKTKPDVLAKAIAIIDEAKAEFEAKPGYWRNKDYQIIEELQLFTGYSEPDYSDPESGVIVVGRYAKGDTITGKAIDRLIRGLGCDWHYHDEWMACESCNKLIRTNEDGYSWKPFHYEHICGKCLDIPWYLTEHEGKFFEPIAETDPGDYGYIYDIDFHIGGDPETKMALAAISEAGMKRFFVTAEDGRGLFVHETEWEKWLWVKEFSLDKGIRRFLGST